MLLYGQQSHHDLVLTTPRLCAVPHLRPQDEDDTRHNHHHRSGSTRKTLASILLVLIDYVSCPYDSQTSVSFASTYQERDRGHRYVRSSRCCAQTSLKMTCS